MTKLFERKVAVRALVTLALVLIGVSAVAALAWAEGPRPWEIGMQPPATPVKDRLSAFHDELLVIITLITLFLLVLLLYVIFPFLPQPRPLRSSVARASRSMKKSTRT